MIIKGKFELSTSPIESSVGGEFEIEVPYEIEKIFDKVNDILERIIVKLDEDNGQ